MPATIVYDPNKTAVRKHVPRNVEVSLRPEAIASPPTTACHRRRPARRPQFKGRVERRVAMVRHGVLDRRSFTSPGEIDDAFARWLPLRRAQLHRTHGEVIAVRAERDRAALAAVPERPYVVCEGHLRSVGKDCRVSFEASVYSVARRNLAHLRRSEQGGMTELVTTR